MKNVYMMMHQGRQDAAELAERVIVALRAAGVRTHAEPWLAERLGERAERLLAQDDAPCEAIVAVGGDGTLLRANQRAVADELPLLGVNAGHIGFLVEGELDRLDEMAQRLAKDDYRVERRMMLEARRENGDRLLALNDVVISRGGRARLIAINAYVDDDWIGRFIADGLIVASPTGSTGYSLSAGGPIVCPEVDCLLLSPVCAHSLQHRPVVTGASQRIVLELDGEQQAQLDIDGQKIADLLGKERIVVGKAERDAKLIRMGDRSFFSLIRDKLSEWSC